MNNNVGSRTSTDFPTVFNYRHRRENVPKRSPSVITLGQTTKLIPQKAIPNFFMQMTDTRVSESHSYTFLNPGSSSAPPLVKDDGTPPPSQNPPSKAQFGLLERYVFIYCESVFDLSSPVFQVQVSQFGDVLKYLVRVRG